MKRIFVFSYSSNQNIYGFTFSKDASNLPYGNNGGSWNFFKEINLIPNKPLMGVDADKVVLNIEQKGFYTLYCPINITVSENNPLA